MRRRGLNGYEVYAYFMMPRMLAERSAFFGESCSPIAAVEK